MKAICFWFLLLFTTDLLAAPILCDNKFLLGRIEKVTLVSMSMSLDAKLDTGADMSSLSAQAIEIFPDQGKKWVTFKIPGKTQQITLPLIRMARILNRKGEATKKYTFRPVVKLPVCIDGHVKEIQVNLIDRSDFGYPVLLGMSALKQLNIVVDVSQNYMGAVKNCEPRLPL